MLLGPAEPHGVRPQHAAPEVQLNIMNLQAEDLVHGLITFFDGLHGPMFTGTSVLFAMSQVLSLHDGANGFEVQALVLTTGTAE